MLWLSSVFCRLAYVEWEYPLLNSNLSNPSSTKTQCQAHKGASNPGAHMWNSPPFSEDKNHKSTLLFTSYIIRHYDIILLSISDIMWIWF